ncbi:MAG TPA: hypothetical protein VF007_07485 [Stellaceae bacterium]
MTEQEIVELAAILVNEHGHAAVRAADIRLREHPPGSDGHQLWSRIAAEVARLLGERNGAETREYSS